MCHYRLCYCSAKSTVTEVIVFHLCSWSKHIFKLFKYICCSMLSKDPAWRISASEILKKEFIVKHLEVWGILTYLT